jgi:ketosteroid isomerase-like protein
MKIEVVIATLAVSIFGSTLCLQDKIRTLPVTHTAPQSDDLYFKALMQEILDSWANLDPTESARFYAKDPNNVFYEIAPLKYTGWSEYAEAVKKIAPVYKSIYSSIKLTMANDAQVHRHGNLTWATGTCHWNALKRNGSQERLEARWTVAWELRGNKWLIVHDHFSVPLPAPTPPN